MATISEAIFSAGSSEPLYEHSWAGTTYVVHNGQGSDGAVTFHAGDAVGVLFSKHSDRNPFPPGSPPYDPEPILRGMPSQLRAIGEDEAMRYILMEYSGRDMPVFTAAFWSENGRLVSPEPWPAFLENGGDLLERHFMPPKRALSEWQDDCMFSREQVRVLRSLYERRIVGGDQPITVEPWEHEIILLHGEGSEAQMTDLLRIAGNRDLSSLPVEAMDTEKGTRWCRELLAAIGIILPETLQVSPRAGRIARKVERERHAAAAATFRLYDGVRQQDAALIERLRPIVPGIDERIKATATQGMPVMGTALIFHVGVVPHIGESLSNDGGDGALDPLFAIIEELLSKDHENLPIAGSLYSTLAPYPKRLARAHQLAGPRTRAELVDIERMYRQWQQPGA